MLFEESGECFSLVNKYRGLILAGDISQRQLAGQEEISRHAARIVFQQAETSAPPQAEPMDMEELDRVASSTLDKYLSLQNPTPGFIGVDTPSLQGITGNVTGERPDVQAVVEKALATFEKKKAKQNAKRNQHIKFDGGPIGIVFSGDEHFGGAGTNIKRLLEEARLVNQTEGLWHARMGDFVNQFILGRMRSIRDDSTFSIDEEWLLAEMLIRLITPKLLAVVGGNHDDWARKASGMDRLKDLLPDGILYDKYQVDFDVHVGGIKRTIRMRHRWKGSSVFNPTHGIEVAAQRDMADFDIAVAAHTHTAGLSREFWAQGRRRLAVLTNTYKQIDSFADEIGFPRADNSSTCVVVIIEEDGSFFGAPSLEWAVAYMNMRHGKTCADCE